MSEILVLTQRIVEYFIEILLESATVLCFYSGLFEQAKVDTVRLFGIE